MPQITLQMSPSSTYYHSPSQSNRIGPDYVAMRTRKSHHDIPGSLARTRILTATPPKTPSPVTESPLLLFTPSPLRRRVNLDDDDPMELDFNSAALSTPHKRRPPDSKSPHIGGQNDFAMFYKAATIEDDGGIFLDSPVAGDFVMTRTPDRRVVNPPLSPNVLIQNSASYANKRKVNALSNSPSAKIKQSLTPLSIRHTYDENGCPGGFPSLAPLPAPRFICTTVDPEQSLKRDTESMSRIRIADSSMDQDSDDDCADADDEFIPKRNSSGEPRMMLPPPPKDTSQVIEKASPEGHVTKRRARSRPVSIELLEATFPPSPKPVASQRNVHTKGHARKRSNPTAAASSTAAVDSMTNVAEKPDFNRIVSSATLFFGPTIQYDDDEPKVRPGRPTLTTGFSNNEIPPSSPSPLSSFSDEVDPFNARSANSSFTSSFPGPANSSFQFSVTDDSPRSRISPRMKIPKKYRKVRDSGVAFSDDEEEVSINNIIPRVRNLSGSLHPSSALHVPSSHSRASTVPDPRTASASSSGKTLFEDSLVTPGFSPSPMAAWPMDANISMPEQINEFIVKTLVEGTKDAGNTKKMPNTPQKRIKTAFLGVGPGQRPWASAFTSKTAFLPIFGEKLKKPEFGTLANADGDDDEEEEKPSSGRSRKGGKILGQNKPRKSCPAKLEFPSISKKGNLDYPSTHRSQDSVDSGRSSLEWEISPTRARTAALSTKDPKFKAYANVGLGRPSSVMRAQAQALMRRSSSGAFSVSSDSSSAGTPTRARSGQDWRIPVEKSNTMTSTVSPLSSERSPPLYESPTETRFSTQVRSSMRPIPSGGLPVRQPEAGPMSSLNKRLLSELRTPARPSPWGHGHSQRYGDVGVTPGMAGHTDGDASYPVPKASAVRAVYRRQPDWPREDDDECPGRFELEFEEVEELGAGEFGKAMKVRRKDGGEMVFAIKRSKPFEGVRHRLRLREEVDVLQHLSTTAGSPHHNVLAYMDSWEQDETLFILTELCEYGNFAHFLTEYGRNFARLDEARVWKIFAELSSGLRFIHSSGVIHLDLKPANIFITASGRFKIGDFGMASRWPRLGDDSQQQPSLWGGFEREGDKMYLAAEVLQGHYGKETDIFSFGMTMLETAANIVVPAQGPLWHRLREDDFSPVDGFQGECSHQLVRLITAMMASAPDRRPDAHQIYAHPIVARARASMDHHRRAILSGPTPSAEFEASALAGVREGYLEELLEGNGDTGLVVAMEY